MTPKPRLSKSEKGHRPLSAPALLQNLQFANKPMQAAQGGDEGTGDF